MFTRFDETRNILRKPIRTTSTAKVTPPDSALNPTLLDLAVEGFAARHEKASNRKPPLRTNSATKIKHLDSALIAKEFAREKASKRKAPVRTTSSTNAKHSDSILSPLLLDLAIEGFATLILDLEDRAARTKAAQPTQTETGEPQS